MAMLGEWNHHGDSCTASRLSTYRRGVEAYNADHASHARRGYYVSRLNGGKTKLGNGVLEWLE